MNEKKIKEIILMMLTYRLSFESVEKLLPVTKEEIVNYADNSRELEKALFVLHQETFHEPKEYADLAYKNAKTYWVGRNKLIRELNEAIRLNESPEEIEKRKNRVIYWRNKVYDTLSLERAKEVLDPRNKQELIPEDVKEFLARYYLKYALGRTYFNEKFGVDGYQLISSYKKKDPIYAQKVEQLATLNHDLFLWLDKSNCLRDAVFGKKR